MKNEKYLLEHPEVDRMLNLFIHDVLDAKPSDILNFAGNFFTDEGLKGKVQAAQEKSG